MTIETEFSEQFYEKYFSLNKRKVEITLRNGQIVKGVICGLFRDDEERITRWHIVEAQGGLVLGLDAFGFIKGEIIRIEEIQHLGLSDDSPK